MTNQTKYGVISDVHDDPRIVPVAIEILKSLGAEKLLVNGDIGNAKETLEQSQAYVAIILNAIGQSGLESFVQPGSHETLLAYEPVVEHFAEKYSNIIDALKYPKHSKEGHDLVFLPGSDISSSGEYQLGNDPNLPTGKYFKINGLAQLDSNGNLVVNKERVRSAEPLYYNNMSDLRTLVTHPDKTIVVCHVPRKFDNPEIGIDMAEFGEVKDNFLFSGRPVRKGCIFPYQEAKRILDLGAPIELKKENRGNEDLKSLYQELGITRAVSGHFHESSHRATDSNCVYVPENQLVNDLFWNSGHLDSGKTGILTVEDNKVSYQNINLKDYLR